MATVQGEEQKRIGELIRQQRKKQKMTQTELGEALGVGMQAVSDYEKGKVKVIPFEKRVKLAGILDISLDDLMYSSEEYEPMLILKDVQKKCDREIDKFIKTKPDITKRFYNSNYYASIEKKLNEVGSSLDRNNKNYDSHDLINALEIYEFMSTHDDIFEKNSINNIFLIEFLRNYDYMPYSEIADKIAGACFENPFSFNNPETDKK